MNLLKQFLALIILTASFQGYAQDNVFLDRTFWKENPSIETIDQKIKEGNNPSQLNGYSFDAVVYAIIAEVDNATLKYLMSKEGNSANKLTHDGRTYIFWAAYKGNVELMHHLLEKGAKTDIIDDHGNTILNFAASSGQQNTAVYDLCLENGANLEEDLNHNGANALLLVAPSDKDFKLINYFTSKGLDIKSTDANGDGIFNYVARTGNIELLNKLIDKGVEGNNNAFIFASQGTRGKTNGIEFFKYLENLGLNPNASTKDGKTPLHALASRSDDVILLNYFIEKDVDVNQPDSDGNTAFMNAVSRNNIETIAFLLKQVKDINAVNKKGESALALATQYNSSEVVQFLIKNNADVSVIDANGNNLSYYLINSYNSKKAEDFKSKLKLLQSEGFDVATIQKNGNTLFHLALDKNDLELLKLVNTFKLDVNAKNKEGMSPLHKAAMEAKNDAIIKYLLSIGANKNAVTEFDETAYDLASENEILKQNNISIDFLK